ncbi:MAG: DUF1838 family protein [Gammaproteobacteria bacterium]
MNTKHLQYSRRDALIGAAGLAMFATLPDVTRAAAQTSFVPSFEDPVDAMRAHVKLVGSLATDEVISFYRLNIYADLHDGNFLPMYTMNNLLIDKWEPKANNIHQMIKYEAGYYTVFDSYEPVTTFTNPATKETVPLPSFRLGPVPRGYSPDRFVVMGFHPNPLPLEVIGDRVFLATQSIESGPSFRDPSVTRYTNSFMTYSAALADMQNDQLPSAPVHAQLQNKTMWQHWMGMGDRPGGTVVRGFGGKVASLDALPPGVLENFEKHVPQILDTDNWKGFASEATATVE